MKRIVFTIIALAFATAPLFAADAPPGPNPKLKELAYFAGTWSCKGTGFAFMGTPEHKTAATVDAAWILNKYWLSLRYHEMNTAINAHPIDVRVMWGFDEQTKTFTSTSADNMGGYIAQNSSGWDGNKLTWDGELHAGGGTMKARDVFTKVSATKVEHKGEAEIDGKWMTMDEETCTKK